MIIRCSTCLTGAEYLRIFAEVHLQAFVENIEGPLPQSGILERFAVTHDASIDLVHLIEAAILHNDGQHLTPNASGAICDDWLVFQMVKLAIFQFLNKIGRGANVGNDGIFEVANSGFEFITPIEKDHVIAALRHEFMYFLRTEVLSTPDNSFVVKNDFIWYAERDDLVAHAYCKAREIISDSV